MTLLKYKLLNKVYAQSLWVTGMTMSNYEHKRNVRLLQRFVFCKSASNCCYMGYVVQLTMLLCATVWTYIIFLRTISQRQHNSFTPNWTIQIGQLQKTSHYRGMKNPRQPPFHRNISHRKYSNKHRIYTKTFLFLSLATAFLSNSISIRDDWINSYVLA